MRKLIKVEENKTGGKQNIKCCYAKETLIRMYDGRCVRAEHIRCGDKIIGFGGKVLTVSEIFKGYESEIYRIYTEDSDGIGVTGAHAMKVFDGQLSEGRRVFARELKVGDELMTTGDIRKVVAVVVEKYDDIVYNFMFEGGNKSNYIEANGYWAGDFGAQNEGIQRRGLSEEEMAQIEELRRFAQSLI